MDETSPGISGEGGGFGHLSLQGELLKKMMDADRLFKVIVHPSKEPQTMKVAKSTEIAKINSDLNKTHSYLIRNLYKRKNTMDPIKT